MINRNRLLWLPPEKPVFSVKKTFAETAAHDNIKMIEIKLSQDAKPGHGGILPAVKNTPEIADFLTKDMDKTAMFDALIE